jgi:hypothetical protein
MTTLLDWDGVNEGPSSAPLRRVVETLHEVNALVEMLGVLLTLEGHRDDYEVDFAEQLLAEAGHLGQALGQRALELLDAQAAPLAPTPLRTPRVRTARRRAA